MSHRRLSLKLVSETSQRTLFFQLAPSFDHTLYISDDFRVARTSRHEIGTLREEELERRAKDRRVIAPSSDDEDNCSGWIHRPNPLEKKRESDLLSDGHVKLEAVVVDPKGIPVVESDSDSDFSMDDVSAKDNTSTIPQSSTIPVNDTSTIPHTSTIPDDDTSTIPHVSTIPIGNTPTMPDGDTSTIPHASTIPDGDTSTIPHASTIPDGDTSTIPHVSTIPDDDTSTIPHASTIPPPKSKKPPTIPPLDLMPSDARKPFTTEVAGDDVAPAELLPLTGPEEEAGDFAGYLVDGMAKFASGGFSVPERQRVMLEHALKAYRGEGIAFQSYSTVFFVYMGLGKTLTVLTFIKLTQRIPMPALRYPLFDAEAALFLEKKHLELDDEAFDELRSGVTGTHNTRNHIPENMVPRAPRRGHALVLVPKSATSAWMGDAERFFCRGSVRIINLVRDADRYRNNSSLEDEIPTADLVVANYDKVCGLNRAMRKELPTDPRLLDDKVLRTGSLVLFRFVWNVLVLDEAHSKRNPTSVTFKSIDLLQRHSTVVMTGTPFQNTLLSIQSYYRFAGLRGATFRDAEKFMQAIEVYQRHEREKVISEFRDRVVNEMRSKMSRLPGIDDAMHERITAVLGGDEKIVLYIMGKVMKIAENGIVRGCDATLALFHGNYRESYEVRQLPGASERLAWFYNETKQMDVYSDYMDGVYGEDGIEMLSIDRPLMSPGMHSQREDHVFTREHLAADDSRRVEITRKKSALADMQMILKTNANEKAIREAVQRGANELERKIKDLEKACDSSSYSEAMCKDWGNFWKLENALLYIACRAREETGVFIDTLKRQKEGEDLTLREPFVFDAATAVLYFVWKTKTDAAFRLTLGEAGKASMEATSPVPRNMTLMERIKTDPFGVAMSEYTVRYGKGTLRKSVMQEVIRQKKEEVGGRPLTEEERDEVMEIVNNKTGVVHHKVCVPFASEEEADLYNRVLTHGRTELMDAQAGSGKQRIEFGQVFAIIMGLRQMANDARLPGITRAGMKDEVLVSIGALHPSALQKFDDEMDADVFADTGSSTDAGVDHDVDDILGSVGDMLQKETRGEVQASTVSALARGDKVFWRQIVLDGMRLPTHTKFDALKEKLMDESIMGGKTKALVFSSFRSCMPFVKVIVEEVFGKGSFESICGGMNEKKRDAVLTKFRDPEAARPIRVLFMTYTAGGMGTNLQEAGVVFKLDPWWNGAQEEQAVCRAHRLGQEKVVHVYQFLTQGTVDEQIEEVKERKNALAGSLLGDMNEPYLLPSEATLKKISNKLTTDDLIKLLKMADTAATRELFKRRANTEKRGESQTGAPKRKAQHQNARDMPKRPKIGLGAPEVLNKTGPCVTKESKLYFNDMATSKRKEISMAMDSE